MADIFVSYVREDQRRAAELSSAFSRQGWTVWWDRRIPAGDSFEEVIARELGSAKCVVVLWSQASVRSNWVKDEAEEARNRGVLVPVLIDNVKPPFGFRQYQTVNLSGWRGSAADPEFEFLLEGVRSHLGESGEPGPSSTSAPISAPPLPGDEGHRGRTTHGSTETRRHGNMEHGSAAAATVEREGRATRGRFGAMRWVVSGLVLSLVAVLVLMYVVLQVGRTETPQDTPQKTQQETPREPPQKALPGTPPPGAAAPAPEETARAPGLYLRRAARRFECLKDVAVEVAGGTPTLEQVKSGCLSRDLAEGTKLGFEDIAVDCPACE
jgi:TIR domain